MTIDANTGKLVAVRLLDTQSSRSRSENLLFFHLSFCQSAGALQDDESTAKVVHQLLVDTNVILSAGDYAQKVRKIIAFHRLVVFVLHVPGERVLHFISGPIVPDSEL